MGQEIVHSSDKCCLNNPLEQLIDLSRSSMSPVAVSFVDAMARYHTLTKKLDEAGVNHYLDATEILHTREQIAETIRQRAIAPVSRFSALFDPERTLAQLDIEEEKLHSLEKRFPHENLTKSCIILGALDKDGLRIMSKISRELLVYNGDEDGVAFAYLGERLGVRSNHAQLLATQGKLAWTFHNHPDSRIPLPSLHFFEMPSHSAEANLNLQFATGDLVTPLANKNAIVAGDGIVTYTFLPGFDATHPRVAQLYAELPREDRDYPPEKSSLDFFRDYAHIFQELANFGVQISYKDFEDLSWSLIEPLLSSEG